MNEHESVQELLALSAAEALDAQEQSRVERHLQECDICRDEFAGWKTYVAGLRNLPQAATPAYLIARTQARIVEARQQRAERRFTAMVLVFLSLFGWITSLAVWLLVRLSFGEELIVIQTNVLQPSVWIVLSTVLAWASGGTAAIVLARRPQEWRIAL